MTNILSSIVLTGAGAGFLLFVVARLLPNKQVRACGVGLGKTISALGVRKLGRAFWEKIEDFLINSAAVFFEGLRDGLNADDDLPVVGLDRMPQEAAKQTVPAILGAQTPPATPGHPPTPPPEVSGRSRHLVD